MDTSSGFNVSRPVIVRPVATTLLTIAVALAGAVAYTVLPVSALPQRGSRFQNRARQARPQRFPGSHQPGVVKLNSGVIGTAGGSAVTHFSEGDRGLKTHLDGFARFSESEYRPPSYLPLRHPEFEWASDPEKREGSSARRQRHRWRCAAHFASFCPTKHCLLSAQFSQLIEESGCGSQPSGACGALAQVRLEPSQRLAFLKKRSREIQLQVFASGRAREKAPFVRWDLPGVSKVSGILTK